MDDLGSDTPALHTIRINSRRYLGNKYKLLPFITDVVKRHCRHVQTVADVFAGTGAVASAFTDRRIITNDILYSNYICHFAWFSPMAYAREKVEGLIRRYNSMRVSGENYMSLHFADTFFSLEDCRKIGFVREDIETLYASGSINERERALLITSLLYAADRVAKTCGHYDAYRRDTAPYRRMEMAVPMPDDTLHGGNICRNMSANKLISEIYADLVYIDPPYNSRQYCDTYHLLENIARWEKPEVSGAARKMDRDGLKSDYSTQKATAALEDLVSRVNARYILLSYNNMAQKGDGRSNAKISDSDIMRILSAKGKVDVFTKAHKPFTAGKSDIGSHEERLFLCTCSRYQRQEPMQSPLNYTGGKHKLLEQLLPQFPAKIDTFLDLFCGGCNVGINVHAKKIILNDSSTHLLSLYQMFSQLSRETILQMIDDVIDKYGLSRSTENGYAFYKCSSISGLSRYNKEPFIRLRADFNAKPAGVDRDILLYVLIVYAFNNQIRFNAKGEFNLPVGKRDFNDTMRAKLGAFIDRLHAGNYQFICGDFREADTSLLTSDSLVYCDPPYLITCAAYNERGGWCDRDEKDLLAFLDRLDKRGIRFALSNVLSSKGMKNDILIEWAKKYRIMRLNNAYSNASYQRKDRSGSEEEVLIVNYFESV